MVRVIAANSSQLTSFDLVKRAVKEFRQKDDFMNRVYASFFSGFVTTCAILPFDNIKTKIQKMSKQPNGEYPYKGFIDCI